MSQPSPRTVALTYAATRLCRLQDECDELITYLKSNSVSDGLDSIAIAGLRLIDASKTIKRVISKEEQR